MSTEAKIKEVILPVLESQAVKLFDLTWTHEGKHKILQVAIEREDGSVDVDLCASVAEVLSDKLDEVNLIDFEYMLEVCSPGAERKLRNLQEIQDAQGKYVYAKFKKPVGKLKEVTGTLLSVEDGCCCIEYMDKTFKRQVSVNIDNCYLIRLAVKF
ncbi:MAG: ribosome maturation factor RimP [Traorella sp.]